MEIKFRHFLILALGALFYLSATAQEALNVEELDAKYGEEWFPFSRLGSDGYYIKVHKGNDLYKETCRVKIFQSLDEYKNDKGKFLILDEEFNQKGYIDGAIFLKSKQSCQDWEKYKEKIVKIESKIDDYSMLRAFNFIKNLSGNGYLKLCNNKLKKLIGSDCINWMLPR
ncbi:hypothetical protein [Microbulbifer taiwanensis]|uniref:hypothetical protein n=1 Tax=Microbulbifer taiwanensis TaxID=986746 RepID=UPI00361972B2